MFFHPKTLLLLTFVTALPLSGQQIPRAVPIAEPVIDVPRAVPITPQPQKPASAKTPDEDLFEYAMLCYTQKDYQISIKPFSDYTRLYAKGSHASEAWFRLGEAYLKTNQNDDARRAYNEILARFPKSESAASAAYRLGAFAYNAKEFARAATYFETCSTQSSDATVKLASAYNMALSLKQAGKKQQALAAFKSVASAKGDNSYRESALSELASTALDAGQKEDALSAYLELIAATKDNAILGDALLKSGLLLNELGKTDSALKNFKRALTITDLPREARGIAVFGLVQGYYAKKDYTGVIDTYVSNATTLPSEDLRPKLHLIVGNAHKQKQSYRQAIEAYLMLEKQFPDSPEAFEAGYQKLISFYQLGDKDVPQFTASFEERYGEAHKNHEYILMARLIRADWYFSKGDYPHAAEAFAVVDPKKVPDKVHASVLYKKGFAQAEAGLFNDAISSLNEFISEYPKDTNVPAALAQRGICQKQVRAFDKALSDFAMIAKDYPDHHAAEMALYQSGLIKAETRDTAGMIADFEALVTRFPNSPAIADASFQIGRGYFELKTKESYAKALAPLRRANVLDSKKWLDKASQLLISCQYLREDVDGLAKEVDTYLEASPKAVVSPAVLVFLGRKYFDRANYRVSARYFNRVATPGTPEETDPEIWNYLGMAELANKNFDDAAKALDNYLAKAPTNNIARPKALLTKGRALLGLGKYSEAESCATDALQLIKQGRIHAQLQLLQGDTALAHADALSASGDQTGAITEYRKAAGNYVVVSQIFVDPEITPEALDKGAKVLEKLEEKEKADSLRKQLAAKYPNYAGK